MILIGQYDSPFVRRVAVALRLYGFAYEHRPWSVFGDADKIAAINPLMRVPTLIDDDGMALVETMAILDRLDARAGPDRALIASAGLERRDALQICALAGGMADKAVSLIYERVVHQRATPIWDERCRDQIAGVLDALEANRATRGAWWFGPAIGHADIAVACSVRFLRESHPEVFDAARWPALSAHVESSEALPVFQAVTQPFSVKAPVAPAP